ncbi:MAG: RluA family pseudouridine synthase [Flavobacteriaceae bacterium]
MDLFNVFKQPITHIPLPEKFTFPFYYKPHPLCKMAVAELQEHLKNQTNWTHNFGLEAHKKGEAIGKMFGVLVVENQQGKIGFLNAFSGKLANKNSLPYFVPPVYDSQNKDGFFEKDRKVAIDLSQEIMDLESDANFLELQQIVITNSNKVSILLSPEAEKLKIRKKDRRQRKKIALKNLNDKEYQLFQEKIKQESINDRFYYNELDVYYQDKYLKQKPFVENHLEKISKLQAVRNAKSYAIQQKLFDQYFFLNTNKNSISLTSIFKDLSLNPPAGTGDCAAPKLLQFAFKNNLKPIAMAEFWWGNSQTATIRKHKNYYPSCKGKCEPILGHMLQGMVMDENPFLNNLAKDKEIEIIYEDEFLTVINKPTELLSVPGKNITDSVFTRMQKKYPNATGPLLVHRLDMSTSGIMLIAKTKDVHQFLQSQFIKRTITKRYIAILQGTIVKDSGEINLPLRVDLNDRPRQLVCYDYGKKALTKWRVLERVNNKTRIEFTPITGRTHQLRVHSAHKLGLNTAILGDDLYGKHDERLHLHAQYIKFEHPKSKEDIEFLVEAGF